jgi:predicted O-methyltransferase YrrM
MKLEGFCSPAKAEGMRQLILREKPLVCVEIGVFGGSSLVPTARALREAGGGIVYGIDPYTLTAAREGVLPEDHYQWWDSVDLNRVLSGCVQAITEEELWPWVRLLMGRAELVVPCFSTTAEIDILHIDGNHSEMSSMRDVARYLPRVKLGGFVWFDDCDWPGVGRALALLEEYAVHVYTWPEVRGVSSEYRLYQRR